MFFSGAGKSQKIFLKPDLFNQFNELKEISVHLARPGTPVAIQGARPSDQRGKENGECATVPDPEAPP
ncbi:hypothetical protein ABTE18_21885, partial [Acinetobacter baumannii]